MASHILAETQPGVERIIARAFAASATLREAMLRLLEGLGPQLRFAAGLYWERDAAADVLRFVMIWRAPEIIIPDFEAASRARTLSSPNWAALAERTTRCRASAAATTAAKIQIRPLMRAELAPVGGAVKLLILGDFPQDCNRVAAFGQGERERERRKAESLASRRDKEH